MKDDEFSKLLDESTRNLAADVDVLVAGASARGRTSLRRRRFGTAFATAGLTAAVVAGVAVAPQILGDDPKPADVAQVDPEGAEPGFAAGGSSPDVQPARPDRPITVAARDIPAMVAVELGGAADLGAIVEDDAHPLVDKRRERLVHFRWKGTLTTVWVEPAQRRAGCEELGTADVEGPRLTNGEGVAGPTREPNDCRVVDGLEVLVSPAYDLPVKAHGAEAWNHGYKISVTSYNVVDGKNPDGSEDVPPLMDQPAIDMDALIALVTSEVGFD